MRFTVVRRHGVVNQSGYRAGEIMAGEGRAEWWSLVGVIESSLMHQVVCVLGVPRKQKRQTIDLLNEMDKVYADLKSDGPVSARHIEHRARKAADAGVVWPAPLFVLLDDINLRGGRF